MILKVRIFCFDKATIKAACYEVSLQKLGNMDDYIRPTNVPKR